MRLHGRQAHFEQRGDIFVRPASGEQLQHFLFPVREEVVRVVEAALLELLHILLGEDGADGGTEERLSGSDGPTGLPNRTLLVHHFPALLEGAREHGGSLALGLINLDYFRRINDEAGHAIGDRALRHAVGVLREGLEEGDLLVRLGGEEFVLLMPLPAGRAWERLEALRRDLATRPFVADADADPVRITFSAGLACWPQDGADLSLMMRRADLRLSRAKLEGRNRVVVR